MTDLEAFERIFGEYRNITSKYNTSYIFVINEYDIKDVIKQITKMIKIANEIQNTNKKQFIKSKLYKFIEYFNNDVRNVINGIFLVSSKSTNFMASPKSTNFLVHDTIIIEIMFNSYWKETLELFKCDNFIVLYDEKFKLDQLYELLTDRTYFNVLNINYNDLQHFHLNLTKKCIVSKISKKSMDIQNYIMENIPNNEYVFIYGVSSSIKNIEETEYIKIVKCHNDMELCNEYNKIQNKKKSIELQYWLDRLHDKKNGCKIVFGKDIDKCIKDKLLATLFCSPKMKQKVYQKIPKENIIFNVIEIKSFENHDVGYNLEYLYQGAIGIKFY